MHLPYDVEPSSQVAPILNDRKTWLTKQFGPRQWVTRVFLPVTPFGQVIQRVIAMIAAGWNPADKFWRSGDILGAIAIAISLITRVVLGRSRCERDASARLP